MTETEIIKEKKRNIYSSFFSEDYVSKFLFKSILHHVISLEIYENNRLNGISFETICANIPKSIGSRSSIQSILNEALEKNISALKKTDEDNRRQAFEKAQAAAQTIGKLSQRVDTLKADIDSLHGRAVKNEAALARSKDATAQAERQIKTLTRERDALEAERSNMSNALDGVVRQLATLREERDALAAKLNNRKGG